MPSLACTTAMVVALESRSTNMLSWLGSRCWTRMNAMPVSAGKACKSRRQASSPPAEAPIATTGKSSRSFATRIAARERAAGCARVASASGDLAWRMGVTFQPGAKWQGQTPLSIAAGHTGERWPGAARCHPKRRLQTALAGLGTLRVWPSRAARLGLQGWWSISTPSFQPLSLSAMGWAGSRPFPSRGPDRGEESDGGREAEQALGDHRRTLERH